VAIPLLSYAPKTQNERVAGYEVASEEQPKIYDAENLPSGSNMDELIWAAYRQIFSEHQILKRNRQIFLESQLRNGRMTVREFIRGLVLSEPFRQLNFETNSNYRFVEICVQRVLGRDVYSDREKIAWSIVIATKGIQGFIDALLATDEYLGNYGDSIVPYQRRRSLMQRETGDTPFNLKTPRYNEYYRSILGFPQTVWQNQIRTFTPTEKKIAAGNPALYMDLASTLTSARPTPPGRVVTQNLNYEALVPRR
jgi:phycobilisome rod-core linker protein